MHTKIGETLPFYVGKGKGNRAYSGQGRSQYWRNVAKDGYTIKLFENLSEEHAFELEAAFIRLYGRRDLGMGCLVNLTDGGDGTSGVVFSKEHKRKLSEAMAGRTVSEETKRKMSEARKGHTNMKGKPHSEETKRKMSEVKKGKDNPFAGKTHSEKTRKKMSDAWKRRKQNLETIYENEENKT